MLCRSGHRPAAAELPAPAMANIDCPDRAVEHHPRQGLRVSHTISSALLVEPAVRRERRVAAVSCEQVRQAVRFNLSDDGLFLYLLCCILPFHNQAGLSFTFKILC